MPAVDFRLKVILVDEDGWFNHSLTELESRISIYFSSLCKKSVVAPVDVGIPATVDIILSL